MPGTQDLCADGTQRLIKAQHLYHYFYYTGRSRAGRYNMGECLKTPRALFAIAFILIAPLLAAPSATASPIGPDPSVESVLQNLVTAVPGTVSYDREYFKHWVDADDDGCDTRQEVLIRASRVSPLMESGCTVLSGEWYSWYDGSTWTDPGDVDIDHFVPLQEAWVSGASNWTAQQRQDFANDVDFSGTLAAVTDNVNSSKGSSDPSGWLPPLAEVRCDYAVTWVTVKYRWNLTLDSQEKAVLGDLLAGDCGSRPVTLPAKAGIPEPMDPPGPSGTPTTQGAIGVKYATAATIVGLPVAYEVTGLREGGAYQLFQRGTITWTPAAGAYLVVNGINSIWTGIGAQNSDLGYPTSDEYSPMAGGVMQNFQYGKISWNPATGSRITKGGIGVTWDHAGGPLSGLGYPTSDEYSPMAGGIMQGFQYGKISWNPATGSRITKGGIGATWDRAGGPTGGLGYPTTDEYDTAHGGITQGFQYGQIVYSAATGSRFIKGGIGATWLGAGGPNSYLGYPTSDEIGGLVAGGAKQTFQNGQVIWSPAAGARITTGGIETAWIGEGAENGRLGYPTTNEYAVSGGGYAQDYQGGRVTWRPGSMSVEYPWTPPAYAAPAPVAPAPVPAPGIPAPYYSNCAAVKAAGAAPLFRWQPGYRAALDRDNDGIACEA